MDIFVRAPQPPQDNDLLRLGKSLEGFNPALTQLGNVIAKDDNDGLKGKITKKLYGKTPEEQAQVAATDPEIRGPMAQKLSSAQIGVGVADRTVEEMKKAYADGTFNRDTDNFDEWVKKYIDRDFQTYGKQDHNFFSNYKDRLEAGVGHLRTEVGKHRTAAAVEAQDQQIANAFVGTINAGLDRSDTPEAINKALRDQFQANKHLAGKPIPEQEKLLVGAMARMIQEMEADPSKTERYYKVIQGIVSTNRVDPQTKQELGALKDSVSMGGKVTELLGKATRLYTEQDKIANNDTIWELHNLADAADPNTLKRIDEVVKAKPNWFSPEQIVSLKNKFRESSQRKHVEFQRQEAQRSEDQARENITRGDMSLAASGQLHTVTDQDITGKDGTTTTVTRKERLEATRKASLQTIDRAALERPVEQQEPFKLQQRMKLYSENPELVDPEWKSILAAGPAGATTATMANGKVVSPATEAGYNLYRSLQAGAPGLLGRLMSDEDRRFYEAIRISEVDQKLPRSEAIARAARVMNDPQASSAVVKMSDKDMERTIKSELNGWGRDTTGTFNYGKVAGRVKDSAEIYVKMGLSWKDAIKAAAEGVRNDYTIVNGSSVFTADKGVPKDFGRVARNHLKFWYAAHKTDMERMGVDRDDITMEALPNTPNWVVVNKRTALPVMIGDTGISLQNIYDTVATLDEIEKYNSAVKAAQTLEERQLDMFDAVESMETQMAKGVYAVGDRFSKRFLSRGDAEKMISEYRKNPDYAKGSEHAVKRRAQMDAVADTYGSPHTR